MGDDLQGMQTSDGKTRGAGDSDGAEVSLQCLTARPAETVDILDVYGTLPTSRYSRSTFWGCSSFSWWWRFVRHSARLGVSQSHANPALPEPRRTATAPLLQSSTVPLQYVHQCYKLLQHPKGHYFTLCRNTTAMTNYCQCPPQCCYRYSCWSTYAEEANNLLPVHIRGKSTLKPQQCQQHSTQISTEQVHHYYGTFGAPLQVSQHCCHGSATVVRHLVLLQHYHSRTAAQALLDTPTAVMSFGLSVCQATELLPLGERNRLRWLWSCAESTSFGLEREVLLLALLPKFAPHSVGPSS